ncbi:hypothetical protein F5887DRAFT_933695 [Amanita rubescens]|nr:hypothetical protein F5887DRAFT_933695 [Amanita rubescens]
MLPPELISYILSVSLILHPRPVHLLRLSSYFYDVSLRLLYNSLQFRSYTQIERFLATYSRQPLRIPYPPRVIELGYLFLFCSLATGAEVDQQGRLVLDLLKLRIHSLSQDPNPGTIYDTLCAINPRKFIWTGRDPPHHFSIAIVPRVLPQLFRALSTYTYLSHLELTHLSFDTTDQSLKLPFTPSLREVYLGQATFVSPSMIATYLLSSDARTLQQVRLVDTYIKSIWGLRLRRSDIERAIVAHVRTLTDAPYTIADDDRAIELVRSLVVCEGMNERIIGGDRATESGVLI